MPQNYIFHSKKLGLGVGAMLVAGIIAKPAHADLLSFTDNFDTNTAANYTVSSEGYKAGPPVTFPAANSANATFGYDYSQYGIIAAPHTTDSSTTGLRFSGVNENTASPLEQGISVSPTSFGIANTSNFRMQFDMWINFVGPGNGTGSGSTQMASFGYGSTGTTAQWSRDSQGVLFAADGDGGNSNAAQDYRAYKSNVLQTPTTGTTTYAAGTATAGTSGGAADNANAYYTSKFAGVDVAKAVPLQNTQTPTGQTGTTNAGTLGFAWHTITLDKVDTSLTWSVDGYQFVTVNNAAYSGDHFSLGMFDTNSLVTTDKKGYNDVFIDNLSINEIVATPEPSTWAMMALGVAAMGIIGWRRKKSEGEENLSGFAL